jgi:macrolide-specific efflux system membrane fusion protein
MVIVALLLVGPSWAVSPAARDPGADFATATLGLGDIAEVVTALGKIQPRRYVDVGAQVSGQLTRIYVQPGDQVKAGNLLAEMDARLQAARVDADGAQRAEAQLGYTRIFALMAGTVVSGDAREGQTLDANYAAPILIRIADLSTLTLWAQVSEADVTRLKEGSCTSPRSAAATPMGSYRAADPSGAGQAGLRRQPRQNNSTAHRQVLQRRSLHGAVRHPQSEGRAAARDVGAGVFIAAEQRASSSRPWQRLSRMDAASGLYTARAVVGNRIECGRSA